MSRAVSDLCRSIKDEHDPKKFTALIGELIRVLDEERSIKVRTAGSRDDRSFHQLAADSTTTRGVTDARDDF